ncbi:MAG: hypothetical protein AB1349_14645 [Elusimicrobiota bacterium]
MRNKNYIAKGYKKPYIVNCEFISGRYSQLFYQVFYTSNKNKLAKMIKTYFENYYGPGNNTETKNDVYYYFNGEVAVKVEGWEEIKSFSQLLNKLDNGFAKTG